MRPFFRSAKSHALTATARRRAAIFFGLGSITVGSLTLAMAQASGSTDFKSFAAPVSGANDFAVGFASKETIGPLGLLDDGTNFFVTDFADNTLYKFPVTGGDASSAPSAVDNLNGLGLVNGIYYGTTWAGQNLVTFNPSTLAVTQTNIVIPCLGLGVAASEPSGNPLYVDTFCGVFRVKNPTSVDPVAKRFSVTRTGFNGKDEFDGIEVAPGGQDIWAAHSDENTVVEFAKSGRVVQSISDPHGPDGIVFAPPNTTIGGIDISNNVFVNNNDGTIIRIDTNNNNQESLVASGGTRGDYATVGPDGCLYVTQTDRVEQIEPCIFQSTTPTTTTSTTTTSTTAPPTTTTTAPPTTTTTAPPTTTTTAPPTTTTAPPTTTTSMAPGDATTTTSTVAAATAASNGGGGGVAAPSTSLAFTGEGPGTRLTAIIGILLILLGLATLLAATPRRLLRQLLFSYSGLRPEASDSKRRRSGRRSRLLDWMLGR